LATTTGFNLIIKDAQGEWTWASSKAHKMMPSPKTLDKLSKPLTMINGLAKGEKECMIYLPLYSELTSLEIGVNEGAKIEALPNPFKYNIAVFGSSFTHGSCSSGAGLTWPAFFSRSTNLHVCSFGMSGNSKLQPYLGEVFGKTKADALVCDAFSNPSVAVIGQPGDEWKERWCPIGPIFRVALPEIFLAAPLQGHHLGAQGIHR
jgi:hypothetical protein